MTKSGFKNYLLEQEKLLTQIIELEVETFGSRKLAAKVGKPHNYFSVTMKRVKEEKYLPEEMRTQPEFIEENKPKLKVNFEG